MYEATVSVVKENGYLLDYVKARLEPAVVEVDGLTSELEEKFRNYFSLACADTYRFQIQRALTDAVSQTLTLGYKNIFVRDLLGIDKNDFYQNVLVNTICIFDNEYDKQIVSRLLDADKTMCIDGYYNFRLDAVKKKWKEIIRLISDNSFVLADSRLITEFLQYLSESSPCKVKNLSVSVDGGNFVLYDASDRVITPVSSMARSASCEEEIMLNIMWLKPQNIRIYYNRQLNGDFRKMLNSLFEARYIEVK